MIENVYCAVNNRDEIQWVRGSSSKTRYFKTTKFLKRAVHYHNTYYSNDPWHIVVFALDPNEGTWLQEVEDE